METEAWPTAAALSLEDGEAIKWEIMKVSHEMHAKSY